MLGTTQAIRDDGSTVPVGGARLRALLTALALRPGRPVPVASLIDEVWDGDPPADGPAALQALVGRLRRALGREAVGSGEGGYRLVADRDDIDLYRFERLARSAAQAAPAEAAALYDEALALWRGEPLSSLPGSGPEAARWQALRLDARRGRLHAALALGEAGRALPELTALCAELPLDEPLQALRIRALGDAGRPAEALAAYDEVRRDLATRLGTTPGPALRMLHAALLSPTPPTPGPGRARPTTGPGYTDVTAGPERADTAVGPGYADTMVGSGYAAATAGPGYTESAAGSERSESVPGPERSGRPAGTGQAGSGPDGGPGEAAAPLTGRVKPGGADAFAGNTPGASAATSADSASAGPASATPGPGLGRHGGPTAPAEPDRSRPAPSGDGTPRAAQPGTTTALPSGPDRANSDDSARPDRAADHAAGPDGSSSGYAAGTGASGSGIGDGPDGSSSGHPAGPAGSGSGYAAGPAGSGSGYAPGPAGTGSGYASGPDGSGSRRTTGPSGGSGPAWPGSVDPYGAGPGNGYPYGAGAGHVPPGAGAGNLRMRLTTFVGREEDIRVIGDDLARSRLVTLLGPGGAGKTRLSQEAAEAHARAGRGTPDTRPATPDHLSGDPAQASSGPATPEHLSGGPAPAGSGPAATGPGPAAGASVPAAPGGSTSAFGGPDTAPGGSAYAFGGPGAAPGVAASAFGGPGAAPGGSTSAFSGPAAAPGGSTSALGRPDTAPGGPGPATTGRGPGAGACTPGGPGGSASAFGGPGAAPGGSASAFGGPGAAPGGSTSALGRPDTAPGGSTSAPSGPASAPGGPASAPGGGSAWGDGVWFVELAPVDDPEDVPEAVLAALGARETKLRGGSAEEMRALTERADSPLDRLAEHCARRRMLLILDNCEHVVDAAARLAEEVLARCPGVQILATSREPLGVPGETLRPVEPLPDPVALRLLDDRGAAARAGFTVDEDPAAAVEICRRLDGMPLAIELAAARLRLLTPRQIADRLDDRFRLLTGGSRTHLPRQQTLRAVVDWSWDLLDEPERAVLRRLSVFAGGCDLDAAEAVCTDAAEGLDAADLLGSLVDKSLVVAAPDGPAGMRYRLLETVAEYASDRLTEAGGDRDRTERRHLAHYRELARTTEPLLRGHGQRAAADRIATEYENLRTALRRAVATRDAGEVLCLLHSLAWYWQMHDLRAEIRHWAEAAAALGPDPFAEPVVPAEPVHERIVDTPPPYEGELLTEAWRGVQLLLLSSRDHHHENWADPGIRAQVARMNAVYRPGLPQTCRTPASLWIFAVMISGEPDLLLTVAVETVKTARALGYRWELAAALQLRANILANRADWADDAARDAEESLALYAALGDDWGCAEALSARAEARERYGEYALAAADYRAAIEHAGRLGAKAQVSVLRVRMAGALAEDGHLEEAEEILTSLLGGSLAQFGDEAVPAGRMFLATVYGRTGRVAEARAQLQSLRDDFASGAFAIFDGFLLGILAWLDNEEGKYEDALGMTRAAMENVQDPLALMIAPHMRITYLVTAARALTGLGGPRRERDAARLLGAYRALVPPGHHPVVIERADAEFVEHRCRAELGTAAYEAAYAEGGGLTLEEATALI
ncbi:BTAD domain-containing putative transcriptional regulator [Streptomyces sp. NBC_01264]|uniref:BTAD domain-containing putative transcriptional regulator n=1 Tax=Streptomyces sp. NBC_01264 TaxID=2903804 RepID=UPI002256A4DA|nr:BTAD domain-containing putative transcriptional regulator [Streptomyces sp. NBC_01264]MCX4777998.1 winged helix-turn-helix domain-containing protein [Streptomyces sp. NBC_01264]